MRGFACGSKEFDTEACGQCRLGDLDRARRESEAGQWLNRILELDFLSQRFRLGLEDVTAEEARGLMVLEEERRKAREDLPR